MGRFTGLLVALTSVGALSVATLAVGQGPSGATRSLPLTTPSALWDELQVFFPCPSGMDTFALRRCRAERPRMAREARRSAFLVTGMALLGSYDFRRNRFPVRVLGVSAAAREDGDPLMVTPTVPTSAMLASATAPNGWFVDRAWVSFEEPRSAEAWFRGLTASDTARSLSGGDRDARVLPTFLAIRPLRRWTILEPEPGFARFLRGSFNRELRRAGMGDRAIAAIRTETSGVLARVEGYVVVDPEGSRVLAADIPRPRGRTAAAHELLSRVVELAELRRAEPASAPTRELVRGGETVEVTVGHSATLHEGEASHEVTVSQEPRAPTDDELECFERDAACRYTTVWCLLGIDGVEAARFDSQFDPCRFNVRWLADGSIAAWTTQFVSEDGGWDGWVLAEREGDAWRLTAESLASESCSGIGCEPTPSEEAAWYGARSRFLKPAASRAVETALASCLATTTPANASAWVDALRDRDAAAELIERCRNHASELSEMEL